MFDLINNLNDMNINKEDNKTKGFKKEILSFENMVFLDDIYINKGSLPILISAPHVIQHNFNEKIKLKEPFTKAIALYLNKYIKTHAFINNKTYSTDPNCIEKHEYTDKLISYINKHNIQLVLDLHGAKRERPFDIDLGTLDGLTAKKETSISLINAFHKEGILNVKTNFLFKGGGITQKIYKNNSIEVIQIEINAKNRMNYENLNKVINALILFITNKAQVELESKKVKLSAYKTSWKELFLNEKKELRKIMGDYALSIEHIGSTSIKGLVSKPIVDIIIGVDTLSDFKKISKKFLNKPEYIIKKETLPNEIFIKKGSQTNKTHFIHIMEINNPKYQNNLLFRDYLKDHPHEVLNYEKLKISKANNKAIYTSSKHNFINEILKKANK